MKCFAHFRLCLILLQAAAKVSTYLTRTVLGSSSLTYFTVFALGYVLGRYATRRLVSEQDSPVPPSKGHDTTTFSSNSADKRPLEIRNPTIPELVEQPLLAAGSLSPVAVSGASETLSGPRASGSQRSLLLTPAVPVEPLSRSVLPNARVNQRVSQVYVVQIPSITVDAPSDDDDDDDDDTFCEIHADQPEVKMAAPGGKRWGPLTIDMIGPTERFNF